jgi:hypothetical protein
MRAAKRAAQAEALSAASSPAPKDGSQQTAADGAPFNDATPAPGALNTASSNSTIAAASDTPPASPSTDQIELKIETDKRTKVIVVADKDVVYDGTMKAGENHFFSASDHFQVSSKDAGVVHLVLNGKALAPMGPVGQAAKVTLTRDALKGAPGGGN